MWRAPKTKHELDRDKFLDEHIRYRLTHLDVFHCALEIVYPTGSLIAGRGQIVFDTCHALDGSYGIFTNPA
jgi:hypothetical protein